MNQIHIHRLLGLASLRGLQRIQNEFYANSINAQHAAFDHAPRKQANDTSHEKTSVEGGQRVAHKAGTNCLTIDHNDGRFLVSGGADASIRLWDLEREEDVHHPASSLSRFSTGAHSHAITAIKFWAFDPEPSTLISASFDRSVKLTSVTPTSLEPVHTFPLDHAPYTLALSPIPSAQPLIAVGTQATAVRLLDLRSGLATHSLPGHNGGIYSIAWSPRHDYLLASGAADGRVLFFDIRRANAAFGSLDLDDPIGVVGDNPYTGDGARNSLDWNARAHAGAVTGVKWTADGDKVITTGHDNRIRIFDAATGKNDLVHFGPRVRNDRVGPLNFLLSPPGFTRPGKELLYWPNDDGKGDIYVHSLREGTLVNVLSTPEVQRQNMQQAKKDSIGKLTSGGRINDLIWRANAASGQSLEMYSAHGDGRIFCWSPIGHDEEGASSPAEGNGGVEQLTEQEQARTRKREAVGDLIQGLSRKVMRT
jgi:DNA excision repair protein ERCC-8